MYGNNQTLAPDPRAADREGYHRFLTGGSFEVFWSSANSPITATTIGQGETPLPYDPGWYWWACFPGCLPDGEPDGPYRTSYLAYVAARGEP